MTRQGALHELEELAAAHTKRPRLTCPWCGSHWQRANIHRLGCKATDADLAAVVAHAQGVPTVTIASYVELPADSTGEDVARAFASLGKPA